MDSGSRSPSPSRAEGAAPEGEAPRRSDRLAEIVPVSYDLEVTDRQILAAIADFAAYRDQEEPQTKRPRLEDTDAERYRLELVEHAKELVRKIQWAVGILDSLNGFDTSLFQHAILPDYLAARIPALATELSTNISALQLAVNDSPLSTRVNSFGDTEMLDWYNHTSPSIRWYQEANRQLSCQTFEDAFLCLRRLERLEKYLCNMSILSNSVTSESKNTFFEMTALRYVRIVKGSVNDADFPDNVDPYRHLDVLVTNAQYQLSVFERVMQVLSEINSTHPANSSRVQWDERRRMAAGDECDLGSLMRVITSVSLGHLTDETMNRANELMDRISHSESARDTLATQGTPMQMPQILLEDDVVNALSGRESTNFFAPVDLSAAGEVWKQWFAANPELVRCFRCHELVALKLAVECPTCGHCCIPCVAARLQEPDSLAREHLNLARCSNCPGYFELSGQDMQALLKSCHPIRVRGSDEIYGPLGDMRADIAVQWETPEYTMLRDFSNLHLNPGDSTEEPVLTQQIANQVDSDPTDDDKVLQHLLLIHLSINCPNCVLREKRTPATGHFTALPDKFTAHADCGNIHCSNCRDSRCLPSKCALCGRIPLATPGWNDQYVHPRTLPATFDPVLDNHQRRHDVQEATRQFNSTHANSDDHYTRATMLTMENHPDVAGGHDVANVHLAECPYHQCVFLFFGVMRHTYNNVYYVHEDQRTAAFAIRHLMVMRGLEQSYGSERFQRVMNSPIPSGNTITPFPGDASFSDVIDLVSVCVMECLTHPNTLEDRGGPLNPVLEQSGTHVQTAVQDPFTGNSIPRELIPLEEADVRPQTAMATQIILFDTLGISYSTTSISLPFCSSAGNPIECRVFSDSQPPPFEASGRPISCTGLTTAIPISESIIGRSIWSQLTISHRLWLVYRLIRCRLVAEEVAQHEDYDLNRYRVHNVLTRRRVDEAVAEFLNSNPGTLDNITVAQLSFLDYLNEPTGMAIDNAIPVDLYSAPAEAEAPPEDAPAPPEDAPAPAEAEYPAYMQVRDDFIARLNELGMPPAMDDETVSDAILAAARMVVNGEDPDYAFGYIMGFM